MTTTWTITSRSQGRLYAEPKSDAEYWERFREAPTTKDEPCTKAAKFNWFRLLTWFGARRA